MNLAETTKIMAVIELAYPRYYVNTSLEEKKQAANLWAAMLNDYSYELVNNAVKALIASNKFPPTIADVTEKIHLMTNKPEMSELQAWSYVHKAICNSTYNSVREFERLPEEVKRVVRAPEQLHAWALLDEDEVNTVVASNFQRSFRSDRAQAKEYASMPEAVRKFIGDISEKMTLSEGKDA